MTEIDTKRLRELLDNASHPDAWAHPDLECVLRHEIGEPDTDLVIAMYAALPELLAVYEAVQEAPVACHRTYTGKTDQAKWSWIDGPATPGAIDQARLYGWRIENAYVVEIVGGEEGNG